MEGGQGWWDSFVGLGRGEGIGVEMVVGKCGVGKLRWWEAWGKWDGDEDVEGLGKGGADGMFPSRTFAYV